MTTSLTRQRNKRIMSHQRNNQMLSRSPLWYNKSFFSIIIVSILISGFVLFYVSETIVTKRNELSTYIKEALSLSNNFNNATTNKKILIKNNGALKGNTHHTNTNLKSTTTTTNTKNNDEISYCMDTELIHQTQNKMNWECICKDPTIASGYEEDYWLQHHENLIQFAKDRMREVQEGMNNNNNNLDVVIIGDSITERMNGTTSVGRKQIPEYGVIFRQFFTKAGGSSENLEGLALGTSGDTTMNLLWHLQNGLLLDVLQPKVWMILIGTNDLGRNRCSKEAALQGIINVFEYLQSQRPDAQYIIHGLLPRNDEEGTSSSSSSSKSNTKNSENLLREYWKLIQWINHELEQFCNKKSNNNCHYMNANDVFLSSTSSVANGNGGYGGQQNDNNNNIAEMNTTIMPDHLHPNAMGYQLWESKIANTIHNILFDQQ